MAGASLSTSTLCMGVMRSSMRDCSSASDRWLGKVVPFFAPPASLTNESMSRSSSGTASMSPLYSAAPLPSASCMLNPGG
jgi:hypothetical protein